MFENPDDESSIAQHVDQICSAESARWIVLKSWLARYGFRKNPSGCARRARSLVSGSAKPDRKIAGIWNRLRNWRANSIPSIGPTNRISISAKCGCRSSASDNAVAAEPAVPTTSKPESLSNSSSELARRTSSSTIRRRADRVSGEKSLNEAIGQLLLWVQSMCVAFTEKLTG